MRVSFAVRIAVIRSYWFMRPFGCAQVSSGLPVSRSDLRLESTPGPPLANPVAISESARPPIADTACHVRAGLQLIMSDGEANHLADRLQFESHPGMLCLVGI